MQFQESATRVFKLIHQEASNLKVTDPYKHIFVGGFSQGCAVSLFAALQMDKEIGGVCGCSGYLNENANYPIDYKNIKIFLYHGESDTRISYKKSMDSYAKLIKLFGNNCEIHSEKGMGHEISMAEIVKMREFFAKNMI